MPIEYKQTRTTASSNYSNLSNYGCMGPDVIIQPPVAATLDANGYVIKLVPRVINEQVSADLKMRNMNGYRTLGDYSHN